MRHRGNRGFTLIELLLVVVIIGILASIAIPKFTSTRAKAFRSAMMSDLRNLAQLQEVYYNDHFTFAASMTAVEATPSEGVTVTINEATNMGWSATAVHVGVPSEQCGIYHGNAAPSGGSPAPVVSRVSCSF
jgi:prepilin-type N-terminal cleavage/methylation domain-containing protein